MLNLPRYLLQGDYEIFLQLGPSGLRQATLGFRVRVLCLRAWLIFGVVRFGVEGWAVILLRSRPVLCDSM